MTINDVPTNTPIPIVEINRNRDCERGKERGNEPARKDLCSISRRTNLNDTRTNHAIAMTVLKVSSMNRPSSMVSGELPCVPLPFFLEEYVTFPRIIKHRTALPIT